LHGVGVESVDGSEGGGGDEAISISSSTDAIVGGKESLKTHRGKPVDGSFNDNFDLAEEDLRTLGSNSKL
jgi:hypothetical protein